jgi:hypothetical protein
MRVSRREFVRGAVASLAALSLPVPLRAAGAPAPEDERRLRAWSAALRAEHLAAPAAATGTAAVRVGELAIGSPYEAYTLEAYLHAGGDPVHEPLTLSLTRFDCVTLVESSLGVARAARGSASPGWSDLAREVERMRYRDGVRDGWLSRLHYFSEWMEDGERRGLVRVLGRELGGEPDRRPLRFMSTHAASYVAMSRPGIPDGVAAMERRLDGHTRWVVPTDRIDSVADRIRTGDVLAFATSIEGLDVTHSALAHRGEDGALGVLHAPLSGGAVEVSKYPLAEYVRRIRGSTGILVARPR